MCPSRAMPLKNRCWSLLALALWALGCSSTAHLHHPMPPPHPLPGVRRVVILALAGPPQTAVAAQTLRSALQESGEFRMIGSSELALTSRQPLYRPDGCIDRQVALEAAEKQRVDAVLLIGVRVSQAEAEPKGRGESAAPGPTAVLMCHLEVLDVPTGALLFADHVQNSQPRETDGGVSADDSPFAHDRLARDAATALARQITPHRVAVPVKLLPAVPGEGGAAIRRGNALARQGLWNQAMHQWHQAVTQDPHNDVAHYSLGLALEAQGDFHRAAQHYGVAARHADKTVYRQALARVATY